MIEYTTTFIETNKKVYVQDFNAFSKDRKDRAIWPITFEYYACNDEAPWVKIGILEQDTIESNLNTIDEFESIGLSSIYDMPLVLWEKYAR